MTVFLFPVSAAAVSSIKASEQQTFTIRKEIVTTALMQDKIIVCDNNV